MYNGYQVFPGGKERPGRVADLSAPSSAVLKKEYSYTSTPPMGRMACTEPQCLYSTAIPLLPLWVVRSVQSLSACTRVHFTNFICLYGLNKNKFTVSCRTTKVISNFNASNLVRFVIRR